jgi:5'-nucleotidase
VVVGDHAFVVSAPLTDMSGSGASIGAIHADESIDVQVTELDGLEGVPCYGVDGPPAKAVITARLGGFGAPPDLVVAGINPGPNTGRAVLHSGTVGAALTAANFGVSGLAVSMAVGDEMRWSTAAGLAVATVEWLVDQPRKTVINLNVPNRGLGDLEGVRVAGLAPFGTVRAAIIESDGKLQMELAEHGEPLPPDSDSALVNAGYAALTPLVGIRVAGDVPADDVVGRLEQHLLQRSAQG